MNIQDKILTATIIATVSYLILNIFMNENLAAGIATGVTVLIISITSRILKKK